MKSKLALKFFQRRGVCVAEREFGAERFLQAADQRFGGKFGAALMRGTHRDQNCVLEWRKITALPELELLLEVTGEIVMPGKLDRRRKRRVSLHENFAQPFAAAGATRNLREQLK